MATDSDEELLERYLQDEGGAEGRAALDELFGRYHSRVALWCLRIAGDRDRAADLAQDVMIKAYRGLATFRGGSKFSTWLFTIARNHCFNAAKSRSRDPALAVEPEWLEALTANEETPQEQVERRNTEAIAQELLDGALTDDERRSMVLHYRDELPLDAVTRLLGLTNDSGAKACIVSAKRKLKRAWERRQLVRRPTAPAGDS